MDTYHLTKAIGSGLVISVMYSIKCSLAARKKRGDASGDSQPAKAGNSAPDGGRKGGARR